MAKIKVIHPQQREAEVSSGGMTRRSGVSQRLTGAKNIFMLLSTLPPGCQATPHHHVNCETAIYVLRGQGKFLKGEGLSEAEDISAGDFIYIPPGAVHQPVNLSATELMEFIVARNTPEEVVEEYRGPIGGKATGKK